MREDIFEVADWRRADSLVERAAVFQAAESVAYDEVRAEKRLRRWHEQANFKEAKFLSERLSAEGLTEKQLRQLLGESAGSVKARFPETPAWLVKWSEAFRNVEQTEAAVGKEQWQANPSLAFLTAIAPLMRKGWERLRSAVAELSANSPNDLPFDPSTIEQMLFGRLPAELAAIMSRTMVLELNVARVSEELAGETADERFESFIAKLAEPEYSQRIFTEYPVLARLLTETIDRRIDAGLELIERLARDWTMLRLRLCDIDDPGKLSEVSFGMGDTHRGGRTVAVLTFESGFKLVYKPRSLAVESHFQELLTWLNERGEHPAFRLMQVIDCGEYGWVEFINASGCQSQDEARRFYQRQGAYLALLYGLEATDFHSENLIAAGEHPMLIDLESLFHARETIESSSESKAVAAANQAIGNSVIRIGLLPVRIWGNEEADGIDLSGLGGAEGQLSPSPTPYWEGAGTDEMRLERKRMPIHASQNRPTIEGQTLNALDYAEDILAGFTQMYRLLLQHCDELINGPLAAFGQDEIRSILRPTMIYSLMIGESRHPDLQRDALDRDRFFDRMWLAVEHRPELSRAVPFELRDMREGDVPLFTSRPASRDLFASCGQQVEAFFEQTGLELVECKLRSLSSEDYQRQCWFIRASLSALAEEVKPTGQLSANLIASRAEISKEELIAAACRVGNRLEESAYQGKDDALWLGLTFIKEKHWALMPIGVDLYDGLPGIALFLAHLGRITGQRRFTNLSRAAVVSIRRQIEESKRRFSSVGAFSGVGGVIYAFTHLADLVEQPELLDEAEALTECISELLKQDKVFDIIGGAAGCLVALLGLHRRTSSERAMRAAIECGEHLLASAQPMECGAAWKVDDYADVPLTGFSHGASGGAYALLELFAATGDQRFRFAALSALDYERSLYSAEHCNWPDLREQKNPDGSRKAVNDAPQFMWAWCHGAPGAALSRIKMLSVHPDENLRTEAKAAALATLHFGMGGNHSLCHGALGNLETLLLASRAFDERQLAESVNGLATAIVESINDYGWVCGNPMNVESPGLMTGLAGIGYQLLRIAEPESIPSLLALDAPIGAKAKVKMRLAAAA